MDVSTNGHLKILSVEDILNAPDLKEETVDVPEWGGAVRIRGFTKAETQRIRQEATLRANTQTQKRGDIDTAHLEMLMLVNGIVEPKLGKEHILALRGKAAGPIERILQAVLKLSGMTEAAVEEAEATFQEEPGTAF